METLLDKRGDTLLEIEMEGDAVEVVERDSRVETVCVALAFPDATGERVELGDGDVDVVDVVDADVVADPVELDVADDVFVAVDVRVAVVVRDTVDEFLADFDIIVVDDSDLVPDADKVDEFDGRLVADTNGERVDDDDAAAATEAFALVVKDADVVADPVELDVADDVFVAVDVRVAVVVRDTVDEFLADFDIIVVDDSDLVPDADKVDEFDGRLVADTNGERVDDDDAAAATEAFALVVDDAVPVLDFVADLDDVAELVDFDVFELEADGETDPDLRCDKDIVGARVVAAATVTVPVRRGDADAVRDTKVDLETAGVTVGDDVGAAPATATARGAAASEMEREVAISNARSRISQALPTIGIGLCDRRRRRGSIRKRRGASPRRVRISTLKRTWKPRSRTRHGYRHG